MTTRHTNKNSDWIDTLLNCTQDDLEFTIRFKIIIMYDH